MGFALPAAIGTALLDRARPVVALTGDGGLLMISDPKTTPDSRAGRVCFAALVAFVAWYIQFRLFRTNGLLWSLAACSALVPIVDRLLPGARYAWASRPSTSTPSPALRAA